MINVLVNYYIDKNPERQKEINECFKINMNNPHINLIIINSQERIKYSYYFNYLNTITSTEDVNIIANTDIYFDDTVILFEKIDFNTFFALSRWEVKKNNEFTHCNRQDSQDVWAWRGKSKDIYCDFNIGIPGCDNRLAYEANKAGYKIKNPSFEIKTYHLHTSNVRNYNLKNKNDIIPGPYLTVFPENL